MRKGEPEEIERIFRPTLGERLITVDASDRYFAKRAGVTDPE